MTARIILVRHGETTSNVNRFLDSFPPGAELTDRGRKQAYDVGVELADYCSVAPGEKSFGTIDAVYSSIAIRAQQTAMALAAGLEDVAGVPHRTLRVQPRVGIHELSAGDVEMRNDDEAHKIYNKTFVGWLHGDPAARTPGEDGESLSDIMARYQPVLEDIAGAHTHDAIVVSHGAAIRTMATHATGTDPEFAFAGYLANCRFIVLAPNGQEFGRWSLIRWADLDRQI